MADFKLWTMCPVMRVEEAHRWNEERKIRLEQTKRIAIIAHNNKKPDILEWARYNKIFLARHELYATGTTGKLLEQELGIPVHKLQSGPLGGDQQIGAKISMQEIDILIFFWDPLEQQPHDPDVKALLRIAVVWNIPIACNRASADFLISSRLMENEYRPDLPDYQDYLERNYEEQAAQVKTEMPIPLSAV
jgi:methylglyoxal synthase